MDDFIENINELIQSHEEEIKGLEAKIRQLKAARNAYVHNAPKIDDAKYSQYEVRDLRKVRPEKTVKAHVLEILTENSEGMKWEDILSELHKRYSASLRRESLSPQLSRLKRERKVTNIDGVWKLLEPDFLVEESRKKTSKNRLRKLKMR